MVFSVISGQLAKDDSDKRFEEISRQLQQISAQLQVIDAKLDRIDLALSILSDKNDEILEAVHSVPAQTAFLRVLGDITIIENHWSAWTKSRLSSTLARSDIKVAYEKLSYDAAALYKAQDPTYTATLAVALRLNLDLADKLNYGRSEIDAIKNGYRDYFDSALASASPMKPGDAVNATDSFPTRLAKRRALIAMYLGPEYAPQSIVFVSGPKSGCTQVYPPPTSGLSYMYSEIPIANSLMWDPPVSKTVFLGLVRPNAVSVVQGPTDNRLWWVERDGTPTGDIEEGGRSNLASRIEGSWDLVAAVGTDGQTFKYIGAYYRPSRVNHCGIGNDPQHFGVLTNQRPPSTPEEFLKTYGNISHHELHVYVDEKLVQANKQLKRLAAEPQRRPRLLPHPSSGRLSLGVIDSVTSYSVQVAGCGRLHIWLGLDHSGSLPVRIGGSAPRAPSAMFNWYQGAVERFQSSSSKRGMFPPSVARLQAPMIDRLAALTFTEGKTAGE